MTANAKQDLWTELAAAFEPNESAIKEVDKVIRELGNRYKIPILAMLLGLSRIQGTLLSECPPADHAHLIEACVLFLEGTVNYHALENGGPLQ